MTVAKTLGALLKASEAERVRLGALLHREQLAHHAANVRTEELFVLTRRLSDELSRVKRGSP